MARINSGGWKSGDLRIWSGELDNIPSGWELAAEMIDRAVVGAGGAYAKGQQFGADSRTPSVSVNNHTLSTSRMPSHSHSPRSGAGDAYDHYYRLNRNRGFAGINVGDSVSGWASSGLVSSNGSSGAHSHGASASAVDTRQKSIAVIWIRKL